MKIPTFLSYLKIVILTTGIFIASPSFNKLSAQSCTVNSDFTISGGYQNSYQIYSTSTGNPTYFEWRINGEYAGNSNNLSYRFHDGTYIITLSTGTEANNLCSSISKTLKVGPPCGAQSNFNYNIGNFGYSYSFQSTSTGNPTSFEWKINGVVVGNSSSLNYGFNASGTYTVTLNVGFGPFNYCSSFSQTVAVGVQGISGPKYVVRGQNYVFSVHPVNGAYYYNWYFGSDAYVVSGQGTNQVTVHIGNNFANSSITAGISANGTYTESTLFLFAVSARIAKNNSEIIDNNGKPEMSINPNPITPETKLTVSGTTGEPMKVYVINSIGQVVYANEQFTSDSFSLDQGFPSGIYTVKLISQHGTIYKRFSK